MSRFIYPVTVVLMLVISASAGAQPGHWVSHANDISGTGGSLYDCGETTAIFTENTAAQLLFFDINGGAWVREDLTYWQDWVYAKAEGDMALAICDSFAVAYNGLTSTVHTIRYSGTRLRDSINLWSYRCCPSLAYLVTDEFFYVFDSGLDAWQELPITLGPNYYRCNSTVGDDFVGVVMEATYGNYSDGYAYSLNTHSFAQTTDAPPYGISLVPLNHGFVDYNNVNSDPKFVGYSSLTNTFTSESIPTNYSTLQYGVAEHHGMETRTTFTGHATDHSSGYVHHMYGYDTRRGVWNHEVLIYDWATTRYWTNLYRGGQYGMVVVEQYLTGELGYKIYSGIDGTIQTYWAGQHDTSNIFIPGGISFVAVQNGKEAWGLNVATGDSLSIALPADHIAGLRTEGENFNLFSCWDYVRSDMDLFAYHAPSNTWSTTTTWRSTDGDENSGAHCFAWPTKDADLDMIFYSGVHGNFAQATFTDTANPEYWRSDHLGFLNTPSGDGCVYDAHTDILHHKDIDFHYDGLGEAVVVGVDSGTNLGWGYSAVTGNWTSVDVGETPYMGHSGNKVGFVTDSWQYNKYFAFNGFYDTWVELSGLTAQGDAIGGLTILVYNMSSVYCFDPDLGVSAVGDEDLPGSTLPELAVLHPVTPNPFNPATTVAFDLPRDSQVRIQAFDVRGRKVGTLTDEKWTAGRHEVVWRGTNDQGQALSSGTYFLRLETRDRVVTQKATLLK